jgi:hypothetical protein
MVGLSQNRKIMALRNLTTVESLFYIIYEDPPLKKIIEIALIEGPITYDFTVHLRTRDHTI